MFESSDLSRENVSREIGRIEQCPTEVDSQMRTTRLRSVLS